MNDPNRPVSQVPPIPEGCGILPFAENRLPENRLHRHAGPQLPGEANFGASSAEGDRMEQTYRRVLARAFGLCAGALLLTAAIAASLVSNPGTQQNPFAGQIAAKAIFVTQLLF